MADYYPLIARAIAGLDPSAPGESRRALYERARSALIAQLRSVQPPLSESEITRERLSLEEAVRKVESEAAQRARDASRPGGAGAAARRRRLPPRQCAPAGIRRGRSNPPRPRPASPPPAREPPSAAGTATSNARRAICGPMRRRRRRRVRRSCRCRNRRCRRPVNGQARRAAAPTIRRRRCRSRPGMRGFRDIAADADDLGRAAAQANRSARKTYANVPSPSPEFDRLEPSMENRGADPEAPYSYDELLEEADRYSPQASPMQPPPQRSRLSQDRDREPKKARRVGAAFPFKSAIAVGIVLDRDRRCDGRGQVGHQRGEQPVQILARRRSAEGSVSAAVEAEDPRSRRPAVVATRWRRWRSAWCCMTRTRPIPRASNMSAR